jgi:hypothetical protein
MQKEDSMTKKKDDALVNYGDFTLDDTNELEREAKENSGGNLIYKFPQGRTVLRVVPPKKGEKLMKVAYVHYLDVPGVGRVSFNCPRLMAKRGCAVCRKEAELLATGEDIDFKKSRKLKAKRQLFMCAVIRGQEDLGVRVIRFGKMIEDQLIEIRRDEDDGGNFAHPVTGFDLKISRSGETENDTKYKVVKTGGPKPLSDDATQMATWIEEQPSLDRFLRVLSDEQIERKLNGEDGGESSSPRRRREEDEARPAARKPQRRMDEEIEDAEIEI